MLLRFPLEGCDLRGVPVVVRLEKRKDVVVEYVEDLDAAALSRYEVVIVPNMGGKPMKHPKLARPEQCRSNQTRARP